MLPEPPCIRLLVGCSDSDSGGGNATGDSGSARSNQTPRSSYQSSLSSPRSSTTGIASSLADSIGASTSSVRSTLGDLSARLPSFASGALIGRSAKQYTAHYIITARNVGRNALQGVKITHGPLPFGAEFDASRSDKSCFLSTKVVECTIDLAQGAQKELSLVYKAGGSMSCAFARLLEKAKATVNAVTGSATANQVVTTVTCRMEAVDGASSSLSSSSMNANGNGANGNGLNQGSASVGATGNSAGLLTQGSGALSGTAGSKVSDYKQGYKQYSAVLPRTGAMQDFFASAESPNSMIIQRTVVDSSFSMGSIFTISIVSLFIIFVVLKRSFRY